MKDCECKCNFTENIKESSVSVWLLALCSFLLGITIGTLISPVKNGVSIKASIGSNNGCNNKGLTSNMALGNKNVIPQNDNACDCDCDCDCCNDENCYDNFGSTEDVVKF